MSAFKLGPYPPCLEDMEVCTIAKHVDEAVKRLNLRGVPMRQTNLRSMRDSRIARLRSMAIEKGEYRVV